jgi:hypothetical protein
MFFLKYCIISCPESISIYTIFSIDEVINVKIFRIKNFINNIHFLILKYYFATVIYWVEKSNNLIIWFIKSLINRINYMIKFLIRFIKFSV